jgi:predicted heme/steroid binding protein
MPSMRTLSRNDLRLFNGEDNDRIYVAYKSTVYDVTDCPKWRSSLHYGLHFPDQDLTNELDNNAPHAGGVFRHPCVQIIGRLAVE